MDSIPAVLVIGSMVTNIIESVRGGPSPSLQSRKSKPMTRMFTRSVPFQATLLVCRIGVVSTVGSSGLADESPGSPPLGVNSAGNPWPDQAPITSRTPV